MPFHPPRLIYFAELDLIRPPRQGESFTRGVSIMSSMSGAGRAGEAIRWLCLSLIALPFAGWAQSGSPDSAAPASAASGPFALHGQATVVEQAHDAFTSPYQGTNSLAPDAVGRETFDATVFAGVRPWRGGEAWINPEVDQGFGLSDTLGVAGFPSGEAYKVGKATPYFRLQRLFFRQTLDLSGKAQTVDAAANQMSGSRAENYVAMTVGKFSVTDVFDQNDLAHDPRHDVLNWALLDAGTFDYAADAWGYTVGAAVEWRRGRWSLRSGVFDLSDVPNSEKLDPNFGQFQMIEEAERRFSIAGHAGSLKVTGFLTRGRMGRYADAIALARLTDSAASTALVRHYRNRTGLSLNLQQQVSDTIALFGRAGLAGGDVEPYEFTDIDRTVSGGVSLNGARWGRKGDSVVVAGVVNGISDAHRRYLAAGGLGILIGDGRLPHYGAEDILESYYDVGLNKIVHVALDLQVVNNPAYNRDRGPVAVGAIRLHAQF
jgi:high affinity Mn2+ porin